MAAHRPLVLSLLLALPLLARTGDTFGEAPGVGDVLSRMPFTGEHVSGVLAGRIATTGVHPMSDHEVAVGVACLLNARSRGESVDSIAGGMWASPSRRVTASGEIAAGDAIRALAPLRFPADSGNEVARYADAGPGDVLNLSAAEIERFRQLPVGAGVSAVEDVVRDSLARRYRAYREGGVEALASYDRGYGTVAEPGRELEQTLRNAVYLANHMPAVYDALLRYPHGGAGRSGERFFWYVSSLKKRPSFALGHRISAASDEMGVLVERLYYVSHTLNSGQLAIGLMPTREGRLLVYVNRVWSDELSGGLFAGLKKSAAHGYLVQQMGALLEQLGICRG